MMSDIFTILRTWYSFDQIHIVILDPWIYQFVHQDSKEKGYRSA